MLENITSATETQMDMQHKQTVLFLQTKFTFWAAFFDVVSYTVWKVMMSWTEN